MSVKNMQVQMQDQGRQYDQDLKHQIDQHLKRQFDQDLNQGHQIDQDLNQGHQIDQDLNQGQQYDQDLNQGQQIDELKRHQIDGLNPDEEFELERLFSSLVLPTSDPIVLNYVPPIFELQELKDLQAKRRKVSMDLGEHLGEHLGEEIDIMRKAWAENPIDFKQFQTLKSIKPTKYQNGDYIVPAGCDLLDSQQRNQFRTTISLILQDVGDLTNMILDYLCPSLFLVSMASNKCQDMISVRIGMYRAHLASSPLLARAIFRPVGKMELAMNCDAFTLERIGAYLTFHNGLPVPKISRQPLRSVIMREICQCQWDADMLDSISDCKAWLYEFIKVGRKISFELVHLCCAKVASLIKGNSLKKISANLAFQNVNEAPLIRNYFIEPAAIAPTTLRILPNNLTVFRYFKEKSKA